MIPMFKVSMHPSAAERVAAVLESGYIGQGQLCEDFEQSFGLLVGAPEPPLMVNSCTSALDLALHLIGVGAGDEVIATPVTCVATVSGAATRGATLVWGDVDPITGLLDPGDVARKITAKTKAIVAVDWAGRSCDYGALRDAAQGIPVVQDAAHRVSLKGNVTGDYVCWSHQAIKFLTTGDGGMLLCPSDKMERGRLLRWYGLNRRSSADFRCAQEIEEIGYKYQSNDIAAAIGLANIGQVERLIAAAQANAAWYCRALTGVPGVEVPPFDPGCSYWLMTILVNDRDRFITYMVERGIVTSLVHDRCDKHPALRQVSNLSDLPGVDAFYRRQISIPVGGWVTESDREYIAAAVAGWHVRTGVAV